VGVISVVMRVGWGGHTVSAVMSEPGVPEVRRRGGGSVRRWAVDAVVAVTVALAQVGGAHALAVHRGRPVTSAGFALLAAGGAVLVARRRFPVLVLAATYATTLSYLAVERHGGAEWLAVIVAFGTAIYCGRRRAAVAFLVAGYVGFLWGPALLGRHHAPSAVFALSLGSGLVVLLGVAESIRLRRQRALALARSREEELRRRTSEERLRIARGLHDVVAHNISVIKVQANTALHLMDRQPERARSALVTIDDASRQALVELRSVLGVLRGVDELAPRAPSPSLARLDELVENVRASGLAVRVEETGPQRSLPANVDLAAYRIVQEALTNSARHSGGANAVVRIGYDRAEVVIEVDDDGVGRAGVGSEGSGNGIIGMTERAHALGGSVEVGPRPAGGFSVHARLPCGGEAS
jgi:signal transduction histidine kinase